MRTDSATAEATTELTAVATARLDLVIANSNKGIVRMRGNTLDQRVKPMACADRLAMVKL
jgi:hypothetical protein